MTTQTKLCRWCNEPLPDDLHFNATLHPGDCATQSGRKRSRDYMRNLYATDARYREYMADYRRNHREMQRAANRKSQTYICITCGASRHLGQLNNAARPTFRCGKCKAKDRPPTTHLTQCFFCGKEVERQQVRYAKSYCKGCKGILTRKAQLLGVTREWMRQLVNKAMSTGAHQTRLDALNFIVERWEVTA